MLIITTESKEKSLMLFELYVANNNICIRQFVCNVIFFIL